MDAAAISSKWSVIVVGARPEIVMLAVAGSEMESEENVGANVVMATEAVAGPGTESATIAGAIPVIWICAAAG
jgi:hypothetical protein